MSEKAQKALETFRELIEVSGGIYSLLLEEHHSWDSWDEMPDIDEAINELKALRKRVGELEGEVDRLKKKYEPTHDEIIDYLNGEPACYTCQIWDRKTHFCFMVGTITTECSNCDNYKALTLQEPTQLKTEERT